MQDYRITDSILYIGADDKTIDLFESQYVVPKGVSYNSYLILDEKVAIMDTVDARATEEWFANLEKALDGRTPDYLIVSHLEPDHAANIQKAAEKYPSMQLVGNANCGKGGRFPKSGTAHPVLLHGPHGPLAGGYGEL